MLPEMHLEGEAHGSDGNLIHRVVLRDINCIHMRSCKFRPLRSRTERAGCKVTGRPVVMGNRI